MNARGLISFDKHLAGGYQHIFSRVSSIPHIAPIPFLTALWSFPSNGNTCYWQTDNSTIIEMLDDLLETGGSVTEFHPSLLFVVTWEEIQINPDDPFKVGTLLYCVYGNTFYYLF